MRHDKLIEFICLLLSDNWSIRRGFGPYQTPRILLESCLSCGSPTPLVQCGAQCGQARYCNQKCADTHWEEHQVHCQNN